MGIDEYLAYHEGFGQLLYDWGIIAYGKNTIGGYAWPWTVYGATFALVVGIPAAVFTNRIFSRHRCLFYLLLIAGFIFVSGAIGFENIRVYLISYREGYGSNITMILEELCEMMAVSLVVFVFLRYRGERIAERASGGPELATQSYQNNEIARQ
jgi:hypothetical protein